jgi:hypothetical protein
MNLIATTIIMFTLYTPIGTNIPVAETTVFNTVKECEQDLNMLLAANVPEAGQIEGVCTKSYLLDNQPILYKWPDRTLYYTAKK